MIVKEQTTHKDFIVFNFWQERFFNINTNKLDYAIVGIYQNYPKAIVVLGIYENEEERTFVYDSLCDFARQDKELLETHKFIMPTVVELKERGI